MVIPTFHKGRRPRFLKISDVYSGNETEDPQQMSIDTQRKLVETEPRNHNIAFSALGRHFCRRFGIIVCVGEQGKIVFPSLDWQWSVLGVCGPWSDNQNDMADDLLFSRSLLL